MTSYGVLMSKCCLKFDISVGVMVVLDTNSMLKKYFDGESLELIVAHGKSVAELALDIGHSLGLADDELIFIEEAAMLHDIGVCRVHAPGIGMSGGSHYIMHGILGRAILEDEGLPRHALVCERHIGVGLNEADIVSQGLPLPIRDMTPQVLTEEIICFSDLFFSKTPGRLSYRKPVQRVREKLAGFGEGKVQIFDTWLVRFGDALLKD